MPLNPVETANALLALARGFEALAECPLVHKENAFNAAALSEWVAGGAETEAAREAGRFILYVIGDPGVIWHCGAFDLKRALAKWSDHDRESFAAWVMHPFFV